MVHLTRKKEQKKLMKEQNRISRWSYRAWIIFGLLVSMGTLIYVLSTFNVYDYRFRTIALIAVLIPLHVVEEWVFPGGFHYQYNVLLHRSETPNAYPMNRVSDMWTNLLTTFFYLGLAIYTACSNYLYVGGILLGTIAFCTLEVCLHTFFGFKMYLKFKDKGKKTIYGPGSITAYFGFLPLLVLSCYGLIGYNLTWVDCLIAAGILLFIALIAITVPESTLKKKDSPYYFKDEGYYTRFLDK